MEQVVGNWDQRKDVENDENMTECARSAVMLDREISPNLFKVYINDCLLYTSPSPRDRQKSRMPSSA